MPTKSFSAAILLAFGWFVPAWADEERGNEIHHAFHMDAGTGPTDDGAAFLDWDFSGWMGTDENKLWLRSEGENHDGATQEAELWAMYSRILSTFWDAQLGVRYDVRPAERVYAVLGFDGLAPYFVETEAHLFVSEDGDVSVRLHIEKEFLFTQRFSAQPYLEANLFAQNVPALEMGAGLSSAELGLQLRYDVTRAVAPYADVKYEGKFGRTASMARANGEDENIVIVTFGIGFLF